MSYREYSHETRLNSPDDDNIVPYIMSNILTKSQVHKENDDHVHEEVEIDASIDNGGVITNHDHALGDLKTLGEILISKDAILILVCATKRKQYILTTPKDKYAHFEENFDVEQITAVKLRNSMIFAYEGGSIHNSLPLVGTTILSPRLSFFMKFNLYQMDVHSASLNMYLNEEVEELLLASIMRNIMENNLSKNINNVVKNYVSVDEDVILMNRDVYDRFESVNEGVTMVGDLILKYLCQIRIALEGMLLKEALIFVDDVQQLEEVIVKDNDNLKKALMYGVDLSDNTLEHVVHQMQSNLELNMIEDVAYLPEFQARIMKDDTYDKEDVPDIFIIIVVLSP